MKGVLLVILCLAVVPFFVVAQNYNLGAFIPYSWVELGPTSLTPGAAYYANSSCTNITVNPPIYYWGKNYTYISLSRQGYISFPNPSPSCYSANLDAILSPAAQCFPPHDVGTGILLFYASTTTLISKDAVQYYKHFNTCPYPGFATGGCHVIQYVNLLWNLFYPSPAATAEAIIGDNGAVVLQWQDVSTFWLGALFGIATTDFTGKGVSYPKIGIDGCIWGNSSNPLQLSGKAVAFYPVGTPIPCDSDHNVTFSNATGFGCTCEDFDGDGYVCPENDACPFDGNKWASTGVCGCGVEDVDSDGDGYDDCIDACPSDPNKWLSAGLCGCGQADYKPGSYSLACANSAASSLSSWFSLL